MKELPPHIAAQVLAARSAVAYAKSESEKAHDQLTIAMRAAVEVDPGIAGHAYWEWVDLTVEELIIASGLTKHQLHQAAGPRDFDLTCDCGMVFRITVKSRAGLHEAQRWRRCPTCDPRQRYRFERHVFAEVVA